MVKEVKQRRWNQNITFKVIVSVFIPFFFMGSAFMFILIFSIKYLHFQNEKKSINRLMSGYSMTLSRAFNLSDFEYIKMSMQGLKQMDELKTFGLFNKKGKSIIKLSEEDNAFLEDAREIAKSLQRWDVDNPVRTFEYKTAIHDSILRNVTTLFNKGECVKCHDPVAEPVLGFFMADFPTAGLARTFYIYILLVFCATIASIVVMVIVVKIVLREMVKKPLDKINKGLAGISIISGKIKQVEYQSQDEIGELVDTINSLAERQKYIQQELASFYDGVYESINPLNYEMNVLASKKINEVVEKDIEVIYYNMTLKEVLDFMKVSAHTFFPVVNEIGQYRGVIRVQDLRNVLMEPSKSYATHAKDFLIKDVPVLFDDDSLKMAMDVFNSKNIPYVPVIEKETSLFIGILARRKVLEILKQGFLNSVGI